jgi:rhamnosyltransferase
LIISIGWSVKDTDNPKFLVLLAACNGSNWLGDQFNSILNQINADVVFYISVDRSIDGTEILVDEYAKILQNVIVLPHGHQFGGAARNFFRLLRDVDLSDCDYLAFADQDDIWPIDKLQRAHQVLQETHADGYSSNVTAFWPDGRQMLIEKSQPQRRWDFLFEAAGPGCTYVLRRQLAMALQTLVRQRWDSIQDVGLHDWLAYAFARANGFGWVIDDYAGMLYRQHANNQVGVNVGLRAARHRAVKVLSGWGLKQAALIAELVGLGDDPFVKRWAKGQGRTGLCWLALQAKECRRRQRDQVLFAMSCLALAMLGR